MDPLDLLDASHREEALYRDLRDVYRRLHGALDDAAIDPAWLAAQQARAAELADAVRAVAGALAPLRLTGAAVAPEVRELWASSAELASACAEANRAVRTRARARQAEIARQLTHIAGARRALAAYRPAGPDRCDPRLRLGSGSEARV